MAASEAYNGQMQRVIGLFALVVCACLVAGCGGASLQDKARKVVGDPHATVVSTERVQGLNGDPVTVVVMRPGGSTGLGCLHAGVGGGPTVTSPLVPGCPHSSDAYVELWGGKLADYGDIGISRFQVAAIARARATDSRFGIFPIVNQLTVRCAIPAPPIGPVSGSLSGICATTALPFGKPVRCVAFTEGWRPSAGRKMNMAAWVVRFGRNGRIQSTRKVEDPRPPWSGHQPRTCSELT